MRTRLTEMLGIKYPIIAGAMVHISRAELAAAVSNAGGLGIIASATLGTPDALRAEIRKAKNLTNKPFGVNISLFPSANPLPNSEFVDVVIEEKVAVMETSGYRGPDEFVARLHNGGVKIIHKCASARHASSAEKAGADAVTVVSFENGGAMGMDDITTMVLVPRTLEQVKIPVLAGGGVYDGRTLAAVLCLGAEGAVIGTRFMATKESPAHQKFKEMMLKSDLQDLVIVDRSIGMTHRVIRNKAAEKALELEAAGASLEQLLAIIRGENTRKTMIDGDLDAGLAYCGQDVCLIHDIPSAKEVIERMVSQATETAERLGRITGRT